MRMMTWRPFVCTSTNSESSLRRHLACVSFLLAHGADPLPIDAAAHGDTALHMACAGAHR